MEFVEKGEIIIQFSFRSAAASFRYKPNATKLKRQPTVVLYVDEVCSILNKISKSPKSNIYYLYNQSLYLMHLFSIVQYTAL